MKQRFDSYPDIRKPFVAIVAAAAVAGCSASASKSPESSPRPSKTTTSREVTPSRTQPASTRAAAPTTKHRPKRPAPVATPTYDGPYKRDMVKPVKPIGGAYNVAYDAIDTAEQMYSSDDTETFADATRQANSIKLPKLKALAKHAIQLEFASMIAEDADTAPQDFDPAKLKSITDPVARKEANISISCNEETTITPGTVEIGKYHYYYGYDPMTGRFDYHYGYDPNAIDPGQDQISTQEVCDTVDVPDYTSIQDQVDAIQLAISYHTTEYAKEYQAAR